MGAETELIADAGALAGRGPLLVVGGTFDPPHFGHVRLPGAARESLWGGEGWLVYVPAARSPLKGTAGDAGSGCRVQMLRLALAGCERACVWTFELDRPPPSYTVETLRALRGGVGTAAEVRLFVGADQACRFHEWREFREVVALAEPVVVPRSPVVDAAALAGALRATGAWRAAEMAAWSRRLIAAPLVDGSATKVRAALLARPRDEATLRRLLAPSVLDYIDRHGLYGA